MRSARESDRFPYKMSTMCYFEVNNDGKVTQIPHKNKCDFDGIFDAYLRAKNHKSTLYAVWPGNYRSDLFLIDDLSQFAQAFGIA